MALIYRSILEIRNDAFMAAAPDLFRDWLRWKLHEADLQLPESGAVLSTPGGGEVRSVVGKDAAHVGFRGSVYEPREDEQVRSTFTALGTSGQTWAWVDLERWSEDPFAPSWVPIAPGIVGNVLRHSNVS